MSGVASADKIGFHTSKIEAYVNGEPIFPATLELDITSQCTRTCGDCPSSRSRFQHNLSMDFIGKLFDTLEGQTKGLLLTGGEPTMSPLFPRVLRLAREKGFEDIAVVTNGSQLGDTSVIDALLGYASTIRVSLYDWGPESCGGIKPTLGRITALKREIIGQGSPLQIGISALTTKDRVPRLLEIAESARSAGAHWIYYHPMCTGWSNGKLTQLDQSGVLDALASHRHNGTDGFSVFVSPARYAGTALTFSRYHAAHFLLVIGADGKNYLGAEVKYQPAFVLSDVAGNWRGDFLRSPERVERINSFNSGAYSALLSRHRGVLYNDYMEKLIHKRETPSSPAGRDTANGLWFPHIL